MKEFAPKENVQKCLPCPFQGTNTKEIETRINNQHAMIEEIKCAQCSLLVKSISELRNHEMKQHTMNYEPNCTKCCYQATSRNELRKHLTNAHTFDENLFCNECKFQAKTNSELRTHKIEKHPIKDTVRCRICGEKFGLKSNLMEHRKAKHAETVANCKNFIPGICPYTSKMCWWKHEIESDSRKLAKEFRCFTCNKTLQSKGEMMMHKKLEHRNTVRYCNLFMDDKCKYSEKSCWYLHEDAFAKQNDPEEKSVNITDEEKDSEEYSVFQDVQQNLEPPIINLH